MPKLLRAWFRAPRHLVVLFGLVTLVPSVLLMVSGWRLLQQDREIERQQVDARREQAVDLVVSTLEQGLAATEERLRSGNNLEAIAMTADSVVVVFEQGRIREWPARRLLYVPEALTLPFPGGGRIAYSVVGGQPTELWVLENFLPKPTAAK